MSRHLLLVTLGPVQEFIAQARRTRDLWFGSHLLSEVSRAAAAALVQRRERMAAGSTTETGASASATPGGSSTLSSVREWPRLIFPALEWNHSELEPCAGVRRSVTSLPPLAIPNKLLVDVPIGFDPEVLARAARKAAERQWIDFAETVKGRCQGLIAKGAEKAWEEQLRTFLEFGAAWAELPNEKEGYSRTRRDLEREMASRKLLRDFPAWKDQRGNVPKSSLDGGRETVLVEPRARPSGLVKRYRLSKGEQLDAVGLVKRAGGEPGQFVPIANIALAGWMEKAAEFFPEHFGGVADVCAKENLGRIQRQDLRYGRAFAFDAEVFLRDRWTALLTETRGGSSPNAGATVGPSREELKTFSNKVTPLLRRMTEPNPYVACLVADGDHMGRALDGIPDVKDHRLFSERLSLFATHARKIVEQDHRGVLVYAGGDDVLAFVDLTDALKCAEALRVAFGEVAQEAASTVKLGPERPTLSVGIGVGHLLESLGHLRQLAGDAEKLAKTQRNALAVLFEKRAGQTTRYLRSWTENPISRLCSAAAVLQTHLSMKKVYEIQQTLRRMPPVRSLLPGEQSEWGELLRHEVERTLGNTGDADGLTADEVGLLWEGAGDYDRRHALVDNWLSEMLLARACAEATSAAKPKQVTVESAKAESAKAESMRESPSSEEEP